MLSIRIDQRHGNCHSFVSIPPRFSSLRPQLRVLITSYGLWPTSFVPSGYVRSFANLILFIVDSILRVVKRGCVNLVFSTALEVARRYEFYLGWVSSGIVVVRLACLQNPERLRTARHILA